MKIDKILVPNETCLVEIVSENNTLNHAIYFLDINGKIIDHTIVKDATVSEVVSLIPHIFKIQFTSMQMWEMQCATMYNRIFEPDMIPYDNPIAWQMDSQMVAIIRHLSRIKNELDYCTKEEYHENGLIVDDFISNPATPIEKKDEDVHARAIHSRAKQLEIIREWVL